MHIRYRLFPVVAAVAWGKCEVHRYLFVFCLQKKGLELFFILLEFIFCMCCATGNNVAPWVLS